jgi:hypothetical protein
VLNVSLDASFNNMKNLKEIQKKEGEAYSRKAYITNDEVSG